MERTIGQTLSPEAVFAWPLRMARRPWEFFRSVNPQGGYAAPIFYALVWQWIAAGVAFVAGFLPGASGLSLTARLLWLVFGPVVSLGAGFLIAGFLFVVWHLMGSRNDYRAAFLCWALLSPLGALSALARLVPYLYLAVLVYGFFLVVVATVEVHGVPLKKSIIVWSAILVFSLVLQILMLVFQAVRARLMDGRLVFPGNGEAAASLPGQGMLPPELQKQVAEEMAKHRADVEKRAGEAAPKP